MGSQVAKPFLPLSGSDRKRIIGELEKLPENERGTRVDTLIAWVETALIVSLNDVFQHQHELTPAIERAREGVKQLVAGASAVAPFLQRKAASEPPELNHQPWSGDFDLLQAVLHHLGLGVSEDAAEDSLDRVSRSVRLLGGLPPILEPYTEGLELARDAPTAWLIRAVMYYRHWQGLKLSITWNRTSDAPKGSHRKDAHMSPSSESAKLVEATVRLFGFDTPNRTLSEQMLEYRKLYKSRATRAPQYHDFASPLRYLDIASKK
jgi:hypothetical protein